MAFCHSHTAEAKGGNWVSLLPLTPTIRLFVCSCPIRSTLANDILLNVRAVSQRLLPLSEHLHMEQKHKTLRYLLLSAVAVFLAQATLLPYMSFRPWHIARVAAFQFSHFLVANRKCHASFRCTNWHGDAKVYGWLHFLLQKMPSSGKTFHTELAWACFAFSLCLSAERAIRSS